MSSPVMNSVESLRQAALAKVRIEEYDDALALYDRALGAANDEETRELITINKADVLIALERGGPEVQQLPTILMRRRNHHHTFLAAYALVYKHRILSEIKRGIFYGEIALDAATEANEPLWRLGALNELGSLYELDSRFDKAIACFQEAMRLVEHVAAADEQRLARGAALQNLGASKLLNGEVVEGLALLEEAVPLITMPSSVAEAYIDLCSGYLTVEQPERARHFGERALEMSTEARQIRNAHYLLGEVAYKTGDLETADFHFEELARFYPQFRNLKSLLFALDLRSMVNFRL